MASFTQRRILIVDDVEDNRDMYAVYLEHAGFHVEVAPDGEAGLQMAQNEPFDVVVMDLSMPRMDGWEATRRLKADERTRHIPILILTGHALKGAEREALAAGGDRYCMKPCLPEQLEEEIRQLLRPKRPRPR